MAWSDLFSNYFKKEEPAQAGPAKSLSPEFTKILTPSLNDLMGAPAKPERKETLNSKKPTVQPNKKTPLKKETPKEAPRGEVVMNLSKDSPAYMQNFAEKNKGLSDAPDLMKYFLSDEGLSNAAKQAASELAQMPSGSRITRTMYDQLIPSMGEFGRMSQQAELLRQFANPDYKKSLEENKDLVAQARKLYEEKVNAPYRKVDFEGIDRLTALLGGWKPWGLKNEPEPDKNLELLANINKLKQAYEMGQQKEVGDYFASLAKPMVTGQVVAANEPVRVPSAGGKGSATEQRMREKAIMDASDRITKEFEPKLQTIATVKENLSRGDLASVEGSLAMIAKSIGGDVGNIAVQEATRYLPRTFGKDFASFERYFGGGGKLSPRYIKGIQVFVETAERELLKRKNTTMRQKATQFKKSPVFQEAYNNVGADFFEPAFSQPEETKASGSGRLQELLKKAKGGK